MQTQRDRQGRPPVAQLANDPVQKKDDKAALRGLTYEEQVQRQTPVQGGGDAAIDATKGRAEADRKKAIDELQAVLANPHTPEVDKLKARISAHIKEMAYAQSGLQDPGKAATPMVLTAEEWALLMKDSAIKTQALLETGFVSPANAPKM